MDVAPLSSFGSKFGKVIRRTRHRSSKNGVHWIASVGFSVLYCAFQIKCIFNQLITVILMGYTLWILDPLNSAVRLCRIKKNMINVKHSSDAMHHMNVVLRSCGYCHKCLLVFMSSSAHPHTRPCVHSFVRTDLWCSQTLSQCLWEALLAISVWIVDVVFSCGGKKNRGWDFRALPCSFPARLQR